MKVLQILIKRNVKYEQFRSTLKRIFSIKKDQHKWNFARDSMQ